MKKLFDAIERQDVEEVRRLVEQKGLDVNQGNPRNLTITPMMVAAHEGNVEIGKILKDAGANLEAMDGLEIDVLSYAVKHTHFIEFLEKSGVDIHRIRRGLNETHTLIGECVPDGLADTVKFLIRRGVSPTNADVKRAKDILDYMSRDVSKPINPCVELACAMRGDPTRKKIEERLKPYKRIVKLLDNVPTREQIQNAADTATPLKDVDPKFRRGPKGKPTTPKGRLKA